MLGRRVSAMVIVVHLKHNGDKKGLVYNWNKYRVTKRSRLNVVDSKIVENKLLNNKITAPAVLCLVIDNNCKKLSSSNLPRC